MFKIKIIKAAAKPSTSPKPGIKNVLLVSCGVGAGEAAGVGVRGSVGFGVGLGVGLGVNLGLGEGRGRDSAETTLTVFSTSPAEIKNSPNGTPSVLRLSRKSPFESAVTLIDISLFKTTAVAPSAAAP
ncbi:MAG: hypothetical protein C4B55_03630 [Candidatus Methanophagaceae archaeon]|nr:MAG: hypothetical protein C4B55_03630 [Methanophagales archaeon]